MEDKELFPSWGDLENGEDSFWSADWIIDLDQDKDTIVLTMTIDDTETFEWPYPEIYNAFHTDTVKEFVARYYKEEVSDENIKELKDFLFHWLEIVKAGGSLEIEVDDEDISERDDGFLESENKTLH
jgi:hypothetical protein